MAMTKDSWVFDYIDIEKTSGTLATIKLNVLQLIEFIIMITVKFTLFDVHFTPLELLLSRIVMEIWIAWFLKRVWLTNKGAIIALCIGTLLQAMYHHF